MQARKTINIDDLATGFCCKSSVFDSLARGVLLWRICPDRNFPFADFDPALINRGQFIKGQGMSFARSTAAHEHANPRVDITLEKLSFQFGIETAVRSERRRRSRDKIDPHLYPPVHSFDAAHHLRCLV